MRIEDPVADDAPGALAIGFERARHANAADILFDNLARGHGERTAVTGPAGTLSYAQLCGRASRWGNVLAGLGVGRGQRVALFLDDTPDYAAAVFGALRAGMVPVLLNTQTPPELLSFYLADSGARVALSEAAFAGLFDEQAVSGTALQHVIVVNGEATSAAPKTHTAAALLAAAPDDLPRADTGPNDMAFWMYSSGSTGRPKGIVHLHHDMAYTAEAYAAPLLRLTADDICFSVPKIFFAYGFGNSLTFPFAAGAASLLLPGRPDPAAVFGAIREFRPSVFFGLPTLFTALCHAPEAADADLSCLRLCVSAAETLSETIAAAWAGLGGPPPMEGLGSTELLHIYLSNTPEQMKPGAAGRPVPGYEVSLRHLEGHEVAEGEEGILWVRGHSSAPLYWNRPDKTAETMRGDWIYTGDRFVADEDGYLYFRGRADDLIKVSGQWVYPLEVERCLAEHEAVRECAVLAHQLSDRRMTLRAVVALRDGLPADADATTQALQDWVKARLVPYKYPRIVEYVEALPKTGTGKLDRQALMPAEP